MPNGGSDHCGNCRHNGVNVGRDSTLKERMEQPAFCTVRGVEIRQTTTTYCANHYKEFTTPIGPIYAETADEQRIPYHGDVRPRRAEVARCFVCGGASQPLPGQPMSGVELAEPSQGTLHFCGAAHYARWWKQAHPGEALKWDADAPADRR